MDKFETRRLALKGLIDHLGRGGIAAVAKKIGKQASYVSRMLYEADKDGSRRMGEETLEQLIAAYPDWFANHVIAAPSNVQAASIGMRPIPLISFVQAGVWTEAIDSYAAGAGNEYLLTDLELSPNAFALEIKGDSMLPEFKEGDRVIIDPALAPQPGDFVVAKNGGEEATFKKYRPRGVSEHGEVIFELVPLNDDYPTLRNDSCHIAIVGVMVEHRKYRRR